MLFGNGEWCEMSGDDFVWAEIKVNGVISPANVLLSMLGTAVPSDFDESWPWTT